jgi:hypothetical protein
MKQLASPLAGEAGQALAWPGEGDLFVIPAEAGIQNVGKLYIAEVPAYAGTDLDSCFRRNDTLYPTIRLKCYKYRLKCYNIPFGA